MIRDHVQHRSALELGVRNPQVTVFDTYAEAAGAVRDSTVDTYASVSRAHRAFIERTPDWGLDLVTVPPTEKPPACGAFAVRREDTAFLRDVNAALWGYLGTDAHKAMVAVHGLSDADLPGSAG